MRRLAVALLSVSLVIGGTAAAQTPESTAAAAAAVAHPERPDADRARDAARKPAEIVAFAGVKPGDKVAEFAPGAIAWIREAIGSAVVGVVVGAAIVAVMHLLPKRGGSHQAA